MTSPEPTPTTASSASAPAAPVLDAQAHAAETTARLPAGQTPRSNAWQALSIWAHTKRGQSALWALCIYALSMGVLLLFASRSILSTHTAYNHFAHLAEGWLNGRLDLADGAPAYARNNDFAHYGDKWFVAFPPFPAVLLLPWVWLAGEPELVRDGQIFLWLAGLAPALLFLALQRLSEARLSARSALQNALLAGLAAFGSVYFFTAEQGTVWFAAHVVAVNLAALYLLFSIEARSPWLAGLCLGLGFLTRTPLLFAVPLFVVQALWVSLKPPTAGSASVLADGIATGAATSGGRWDFRARLAAVDWRRFIRLNACFAVPVAACLLFTFWHNAARFEDPFESGYRYLTVAWQERMEKWGLFDSHYLARNLGVVFSMLPWSGAGSAPFRVNVHGLALWFTTPLYLWVLWPKSSVLASSPASGGNGVRWLHWGLWATVAAVAMPTLFYQNTGWAQFGYRFSNDYVVFLFALLAVGARPMRTAFACAAIWGLLVNGFGAWTFGRAEYKEYYYVDPSQTKFYEKD